MTSRMAGSFLGAGPVFPATRSSSRDVRIRVLVFVFLVFFPIYFPFFLL